MRLDSSLATTLGILQKPHELFMLPPGLPSCCVRDGGIPGLAVAPHAKDHFPQKQDWSLLSLERPPREGRRELRSSASGGMTPESNARGGRPETSRSEVQGCNRKRGLLRSRCLTARVPSRPPSARRCRGFLGPACQGRGPAAGGLEECALEERVKPKRPGLQRPKKQEGKHSNKGRLATPGGHPGRAGGSPQASLRAPKHQAAPPLPGRRGQQPHVHLRRPRHFAGRDSCRGAGAATTKRSSPRTPGRASPLPEGGGAGAPRRRGGPGAYPPAAPPPPVPVPVPVPRRAPCQPRARPTYSQQQRGEDQRPAAAAAAPPRLAGSHLQKARVQVLPGQPRSDPRVLLAPLPSRPRIRLLPCGQSPRSAGGRERRANFGPQTVIVAIPKESLKMRQC
ncbi:collagen alpha-1(I) chain-like [Elgaria multicarinata webbii]|uniref:collagen alpha-1(I) chain-like n=1 Tax=Elgaria multicarinata webbii TaxID=159646 RepID=UPI002FCCE13A